MLILVASALIGCPPVAQVGSYGYAQQPAYYAQPQYAQTYAQPYQASAYFQANPAAFAESVAAYVRKQDAARLAAQQQADLLAKVNQLGTVVETLNARLGQALAPPEQPPPPPVQPQPFQRSFATPQQPQATPQYQQPAVPSKQQPQFEAPPPPLAQPPAPSKSSYGDPAYPPATPAPTTTPDFNGFQPYANPAAPTAPVSLVQALDKCAQCHTGAASKRGVVIFDGPGVLANLGIDVRLQMLDAVKSGRMPPRSAPDPAIVAALLQSIQADVAAVASTNVGGARR